VGKAKEKREKGGSSPKWDSQKLEGKKGMLKGLVREGGRKEKAKKKRVYQCASVLNLGLERAGGRKKSTGEKRDMTRERPYYE